ncbi:MFS transporter [Actinoplanes sichuanensis]|uniref:MFS transporter n=1 Tax=Actinoplanes sichuanensis TaxID=512349 RepID=A0ABW4ARC3_9ACTN|nr:MFS transporter [Actinoplanes sichuanensis]BEL07205.1 MFS transporter [Actinoplanes sichuanensis]
MSLILNSVLPKSRQIRTLALAAAVDSAGSGLFLAGGVIYFVSIVGIDSTIIGATISVANFLGLLSPVLVGIMVDRIGVMTVYRILLLIRSVGYAAYPFATDVAAYVTITCIITILDRACAPQLQVIVGEMETDEERPRTMASIRTMRNAGMAVGLLAGGSIIAFQTPIAFIALFAANSLSLLFLARALRLTESRLHSQSEPASEESARESGPEPDAQKFSLYRDRRFLIVCAANIMLSLHDSILFVLLPIWVVKSAGLPASTASVLLAVNTALTVLLQIYLARFSQGLSASLRLIRWAAALLAFSCVLFLAAERVSTAAAIAVAFFAVATLSIGENLHSIAGWELSYELSPAGSKSQYLGLFSATLTAQMIIGPIVMAALIHQLGAAGWLSLAGLFLVAGWMTTAAGRRPGSR